IWAAGVEHYCRLMPDGPPVKLGHAQCNRSAGSRIPIYSPNPHGKRVDFHYLDPLCNPYLAFAAMLMAGIDGFHNRLYSIDQDEPIEKFYDLLPKDPTKILSAPSSPNESLDPPELDYGFFLPGDVFTPDVIEMLRLRPHRESLNGQKWSSQISESYMPKLSIVEPSIPDGARSIDRRAAISKVLGEPVETGYTLRLEKIGYHMYYG